MRLSEKSVHANDFNKQYYFNTELDHRITELNQEFTKLYAFFVNRLNWLNTKHGDRYDARIITAF